MARKPATEDGLKRPPPKQPIQTTGHKRKRNTDKEVPAEKQPIVKRKQIPYQTSTQTLKVGRHPGHQKGINEVVVSTTANNKNKAGAKIASKKILPPETKSDDDFVANSMWFSSRRT
ncbi:hypothetical protein QQ045_018123 [Rhodiola kirilowii]